MSVEDKIIDHATEIGKLTAVCHSIQLNQELLMENFKSMQLQQKKDIESLQQQIKDVRHDVVNSKINDDFKKIIIEDYDKMDSRIKHVENIVGTAAWFVKNWKFVTGICLAVFLALTATTIDFGDKLLNAEPPRKISKR